MPPKKWYPNRISTYLSDETLKRLRKQSEMEKKSVSDLIRRAVEEWLRKR